MIIRKCIAYLSLVALLLNNLTAQTVTATQKDSLVGDHQAIGVANPKDTIRYKTRISVSGTTATSVNFSNLIPANTTFVAGSLKTSALSRDDNFATSFNTLLNTGNVLGNDFGLPSIIVVSFGTTASNGTTTLAGNVGTTNGGGTLTVNADGTFSYQPMTGFTGMDQFTYISTTGVPGTDNGSGTVTINVAPDIVFSTMDVNPMCNGETTGSITFNAMGGSGTLMYSITGVMGSFQASPVFSGLAAGTYNLAVKDAVGYTKTGTTTLSQPPAILFTTTDVNNVCNGGMAGSITFNASGGTGVLTYSITGAMGPYQIGTVYSGLASGLYNLAVKDANNCIVTGITTITEPTAVTFTFTKIDITCNGAGNGSIDFNTTMGGTSPYTYSINGTMGTFTGTTSYTGLSANTYNLVAKDNVGCNSAVQSTTVIEPAAIVVSGTIPNLTYNVAMSNAPFTKTGGSGSPATPWSASGLPTGVNINTATGIVNGTPTQTGMFTATITYTDANGCTDDIMVSFNVAPRLQNESFAVVGNTQLVSNGHSTPTTPHTTNTTNILTNDQSDVAITVTAGTFATTNMGGSITIGSDGKFIYSPPAGSTATDSYTYTGTSNGVSATATITFNIANMVWYVNNTNGGAADGRSHSPFTTCNAAASASAINQIIYVHRGSGNTTGNTILKSGQTLRGSGNSLTVGALTIPAGTKPTLSNTISLANSVIVDGFDMSTGLGATALSSSGATGVNVNIGNVTTNFASNSVTLTNTTGSVSISGGSFVGGGGATINISGGSVSFTYGGSVNQGTTSEAMVSISGGHTGTVNFNTGTLTSTNGTGLQFDNADGTYNFNGTVTLNGGDAGVDILNGSSGSFAFTTTNITNPSGVGFNVNSSTPSNISCNGSISKNNAGRLIDISSNSGGTMTFNNTLSSTGTSSGILVNSNSGVNISFASSTKTLNTGANTAVSITSNAGTTANFSNGGLVIDVTSATGFNATGGGTINVTGTGNTITSTTGTALNVSSTTIGASNINFQSIASNGGTNGIVLNNTGSSGGLTITGTGGVTNNGSGGTIQNCSGAGISLNTTSNVSLSYVNVQNSGDDGISGTSVTGFSMTRCNVTNNGNALNEDGVDFGGSGVITPNGLYGTVTVTNSVFTGNYYNQFTIRNSSGTTNMTMTGCTVNGRAAENNNNDGLFYEALGTASITGNIQNSSFSANKGDHFQAAATNSGDLNVTFKTNTLTGGHSSALGQGITINAALGVAFGGYTGNVIYDIDGNNINGAISNAIIVNLGTSAASATFDGYIRNNIIGTSGVPLSGSSQANGIGIDAHGLGSHTCSMTNNIIRRCYDYGIFVLVNDGGTQAPLVRGELNLTCSGNTVTEMSDTNAGTGTPREAFHMNAGATSSNVFGQIDNHAICLNLTGNSLTGGAFKNGDIRLRQRFQTSVTLPGYTPPGGNNFDTASVILFVQGNNVGAIVTATTNNDGTVSYDGYYGGPACQTP